MIRRPPRSTLFPYTDALPILRSLAALGMTPLVCSQQLVEPPPLLVTQRRGSGGPRARIGRAHVLNPVPIESRIPSFALKKKNNSQLVTPLARPVCRSQHSRCA